MKKILSALIFASVFSCSDPAPTPDEPETKSVNAVMTTLHQELDQLVPYLFSPKRFSDPTNRDNIKTHLSRLADRSQLADHRKLFKEDFAASTNLAVLGYQLQSALGSFQSGHLDYARFSLHSAMKTCISCHTAGFSKTSYMFFSQQNFLKELPSVFHQAEYALATRQFGLAHQLLLDFAQKNLSSAAPPLETEQALRYLVQHYAKIQPNPAQGEKFFKNLAKKSGLSKHLKTLSQTWAKSFSKWKRSPGPSLDKISSTRLLGRSRVLIGMSKTSHLLPPNEDRYVERLRVTGELHTLLSQKASIEDKTSGLYLLGLLYNAIGDNLVVGLGEAYLKVCIEQVPHSEYSKNCYSAFKESIEFGSTGSSGTHIAPEDQQLLDELRQLAL